MPGNSGGTSVGQVSLDLVLNQKKFDSQLKGVTNLAKKAGKIIAGAFAVKALAKLGSQCVELGSDLAEVQNVVDVAFPKMNKTIDQFASNAATKFGLSETMAKRYAGTLGSMAKAFGFSEKAAADMSTTLTGLAGDVASFYNIDQDAAYTKLKAVFSGETESLKDLGVVMTQTALDQYALANGFGKTTSKMTEQEKVALRYSFVQKQLADASGDFARTSDGWANQMRILNLQIDSLKANIGQGLINLFTPIIKVVNTLIGRLAVLAESFKAFTEMFSKKKTDGTDKTKKSVDAIADSAGAASDNVEGIGDAAKKAAKKAKSSLAVFDELKVMEQNDSSDSSSGSGSTEIPSVDFGSTAEAGDKSFKKFEKTLDKITGKAKQLFGIFKQGFSEGFKSDGLTKIGGYLDGIKNKAIGIFTDKGVLNSASSWADNVIYNWGRVSGSVASVATSIGTMLLGGIDKYLGENSEYIKDKIVNLFDLSKRSRDISGNFAVAVADIFTVFEGESAQQIVADLIDIFSTAFLEVNELATRFGTDLWDLITSPIINNSDKIKKSLENTLKPVSKVISEIKKFVENTFASINKSYSEHIEPAFNNMKQVLTDTFSTMLDAYNRYLAPVLDYLATEIGKLLNETIQPLASHVIDVIAKIVECVSQLLVFLQPVIDWIVKEAIEKISIVLVLLWKEFSKVINRIVKAIDSIVTVVEGVIDTISGAITGDWKKAWDGIKKIFVGIINGILNTLDLFIPGIADKFTSAVKRIKAVVTTLKKVFIDVWEGIKGVFGNVATWFEQKFTDAWTRVKNVFSAGGKIFDGIKDGIANTFKGIVNKLVDGINVIVEKPFSKINDMLNTIRGVEVLNVKPFSGLWGENPLPVPRIPHLAKGAVIPPKAPFLAMLGDQQHGTNIETPLDTMIQAFKTALAEEGVGGAGEVAVNVYLEGDARGLYKVVRTEAQKQKNRTGKPDPAFCR
ncbi:MAG: hypothetical protein K6G88_05625 [Lachnospiraceae bacterium]|nr:hypothetical protein [Lachnospiraceae bacterium]